METNDTVINENVKQPKKRGRKPSGKNKNYFGADEEQAFQEYLLSSDTEERNRIFNTKLKPAFTKMIESIIRRYNLFTPSEEFEETFNDTMSFMATKANNFKPGKGKKAYSYCGTICKNYLINKRLTTMKRENKFLSYNNVYNETNPDNRAEKPFSFNESFTKGLFENTINDINNTLEENFWEDGNQITENEKKVGYAIIEILNNWENIFQIGDTQKFNKTNVLYFIKEYTMLPTKDVKDALKKYRIEYISAKEDYVRQN